MTEAEKDSPMSERQLCDDCGYRALAPAQPEGWDGQERRNAAPAKRWCTVTHTHQPHDDCDGTAAPAGELDTLPDEPDCVKIWRARADFFPAAQDAVAYMDALRQSATRLQAELAEASRELEHFTKSGIVEIAVRNPSVMDYIKHWEGRAESAERTVGKVREALEPAKAALDKIGKANTVRAEGVLRSNAETACFYAAQQVIAILACGRD